MFNSLVTLLTRQNITLILSIFGSIGTLITLISQRKNLKINIISSTYNQNIHQLILVITFENRSQLPISVTSVSSTINGKKISPLPYPNCVGNYEYKKSDIIVDRKFEYNLKLPVDIQQLCAVSGYILLDVSPKELQTLSTPLILQVHSTRGMAQKIELKPDQIKWL